MIKRFNYNLIFLTIQLAGIILIPAILFLLPYNFFDHRGPVCIMTLLSGYECIGCGMTRACQRLIHFRMQEAWQFNKLALVVFPILVYLWGELAFKIIKRIQYIRKNKST
ncbi:MAG: DUF2752 domain-containing protein [Chitinophagaceae bacterium]|nr:DUF2752 domain-containing protein [Chitinophagaceae bacterium]